MNEKIKIDLHEINKNNIEKSRGIGT